MATQWFYKVMGDEFGPYSATELRKQAVLGHIRQDSVVRKGTDGQWISAWRVHGLFSPPPHQHSSASVTESLSTTVDPVEATAHVEPTIESTDDSRNGNHPAEEIKSCDFCAEKILKVARKCKHCGEFLSEMSHCNNCGTSIPNGSSFCAQCAHPIEPDTEPQIVVTKDPAYVAWDELFNGRTKVGEYLGYDAVRDAVRVKELNGAVRWIPTEYSRWATQGDITSADEFYRHRRQRSWFFLFFFFWWGDDS